MDSWPRHDAAQRHFSVLEDSQSLELRFKSELPQRLQDALERPAVPSDHRDQVTFGFSVETAAPCDIELSRPPHAVFERIPDQGMTR